jgi:hypothetical protein
LLVADTFFIKTRSSDCKNKGLQARTGRCFQNFPDVTGFMCVQLINDPAVNIKAVEVIRITGYRFEF